MRLKLADFTKKLPASIDDIIPFSRTVRIRSQPNATTAQPPARNARIVGTEPPSSATHVAKKSRRPAPIAAKVAETPVAAANSKTSTAHRPNHYRENEMHIQMLSRPLYDQIFGRQPSSPDDAATLDATTAERFRQNLRKHGIRPGESERLPEIDARLRLPPLEGRTLEQHFERIADQQARPYRMLAERMAGLSRVPAMPTEWRLQSGWTHYCPTSGVAAAVPFPPDAVLVFDIENCVREGAAPTIACALGDRGWYSWVSDSLIHLRSRPINSNASDGLRLSDLIPLESYADNTSTTGTTSTSPRLIVGHNVSYDRARVKEQYWPQPTPMRFLDTMSLHVSVSGVTSYQRARLKSAASKRARAAHTDADSSASADANVTTASAADWTAVGSLNGLRDVHALYWPELPPLDKQRRNVFVDGTLDDIRADFHNLMSYCADDVVATQRVLQRVWPLFSDRFPHPATMAGMLEIGMAYLPVTDGWRRYIQSADLTYEDLNIEARRILEQRANRACRLAHGERWRKDVWMWDEDWSVQDLKLIGSEAVREKAMRKWEKGRTKLAKGEGDEFAQLEERFAPLMKMADFLPKRRPLLPGYPAWYRNLCEKRPKAVEAKAKDVATSDETTATMSTDDDDSGWRPGPVNIGTGMQVTPKLLQLCWEGYPLHYVREHGWGFLVPIREPSLRRTETETEAADQLDDAMIAAKADNNNSAGDDDARVPVDELIRKCSLIECDSMMGASAGESDDAFQQLIAQVELNLHNQRQNRSFWNNNRNITAATDAHHNHQRPAMYTGSGVWCDHQIGTEGVWFFKLPHKDGGGARVGNPMAKDFLGKFADNVLSGRGSDAERVIRIAGQLSYWRNNRDRIRGQPVVWLDAARTHGAILPQVVACGTLTRRASEPTWMTASNAQRERVGSELRGMVQAPAGYRFVGADVDSQELWIAAVLGDAATTAQGGCHGATPFGWMTLNGQKSDGTDMHSVTAKAVGISRDHAKVINYARIYGAGQQFAQRLLKQFNPTLPEAEAQAKARRMFALTKGRRWFDLRREFCESTTDDDDVHDNDGVGHQLDDRPYSRYEATRLAALYGRTLGEMFDARGRWAGGTESDMFNRLEAIAGQPEPRTPFLGGRLSRPLEPRKKAPGTDGKVEDDDDDDRFLPTRVNWVVQSGAVDFLHLMLVCMRWLMNGPAGGGRQSGSGVRFSLSFHDEVRYLVREEDADRAAVAMHMTNLLVRAFCVQRLGMRDLPQSVAFFQSVEIDRVLRKESQADYQTPSNPHGLAAGYGVGVGRSVGVMEALKAIAGDEDMAKWEWHKR